MVGWFDLPLQALGYPGRESHGVYRLACYARHRVACASTTRISYQMHTDSNRLHFSACQGFLAQRFPAQMIVGSDYPLVVVSAGFRMQQPRRIMTCPHRHRFNPNEESQFGPPRPERAELTGPGTLASFLFLSLSDPICAILQSVC